MGVGTAPLAGISDEGDPFMETKVIWELDIAKLAVSCWLLAVGCWLEVSELSEQSEVSEC